MLTTVWLTNELLHVRVSDNWSETKVDSTNAINLPKDDAPHQAKIEWWYYNGFLTSDSGRHFSFHLSLFLINGLTNHRVAHISLSDHQTKQHFTEQRITQGNPPGQSNDFFDFDFGDALRMHGGNGNDTLNAQFTNFAFNLYLKSDTPPILHGTNGVVSMANQGTSYYYSRPRMPLSGTLKLRNEKLAVKGIAWFDHQWGDFTPGQLAWDWFSLQMEDGSDIMLYQFRNATGKVISGNGSYAKKDKTVQLTTQDFTLTPQTYWTSKTTGTQYPIEWTLKMPKQALNVTVKSIVQNSEFDAQLTTYNHYWEGAVQVSGSHKGRGFLELNGYKSKG